MGWFDRPKTEPASVPTQSKYTLDAVRSRLDTFGLWRLSVNDATLKVLISLIAHKALPYLERIGGDNPGGAEVADMMTTLDMLNEALKGYVAIQNDPSAYEPQGGAEVLMQQTRSAVDKYCAKLLSGNATSGDVSGYRALTQYLNSLHTLA
jgi:hypothetical protein